MRKVTQADLRRLRKLAERIDRDEAYFQGVHGDPVTGSVRLSHIADAEAIRRVLAWVAERRARIESWEEKRGAKAGEELKAAIVCVFGGKA